MTEVSASGSLLVETSFVSRIGLAIVQPQRALAIAGGRRHAGRSGSDLLKLMVLMLAATQLRGLVGAIWMAVAVDGALGLRAAIQVMTRSLTVDLAFLVIGAVVLFVAGGKRRDLGRAFDLACVAVLPMLLVEIVATTVLRAIEVEPPPMVGMVLVAITWAWWGVLIALSVLVVRRPPTMTPATAASFVGLGRKVGWGVMGTIAVGVVLAFVWVGTHLDLMRPVKDGDPAPALSLPRIADASGTLGPAHALADSRGRVVVIDFWATWCQPCLAQLPALEGLARRGEVDVIAVNLDDPAHAFSMFDTAGYRAMILVADDGEVSQRYNVSTIPHTVIVDAWGMVRSVHRGGHDVAAEVEKIRK